MRSVRNKFYVRRAVKRAFRKEFDYLFKEGNKGEIVRLARKLIGYSPKTIDNDIYVSFDR